MCVCVCVCVCVWPERTWAAGEGSDEKGVCVCVRVTASLLKIFFLKLESFIVLTLFFTDFV